MNQRNRIIYNVLALYAGQVDAVTGNHSAANIKQLSRVQTFDEDFSRTFTNVEQYGNLAAIDRIEMEAPTVKGSLSYYLTDGSNESYLGLSVAKSTDTSLTSAISGLITKVTDSKNYFLAISDEGHDAADNITSVTNTGVLALGNAFLSSYDVDAAVGQIPKATVQLEALNTAIYASVNSTNNLPSVTPANGYPVTGLQFALPTASTNNTATQPTALQPGDIVLSVTGLVGVSIPDLKIQSFKLSVPLSREPIRRLGERFPFTREIKFPITAKFSIDAELGALESVNDGGSSYGAGSYSGNMANLLCDTGINTMRVTFNKPACNNANGGGPALRYEFRGAKLISQKISSNIGSNVKFTADYEAQIGAVNDTAHGIFISGTWQ